MDRGYNEGYGRPEQAPKRTEAADAAEPEIVEFHSEMPQVPDENVEFIVDEKLEEELTEEI